MDKQHKGQSVLEFALVLPFLVLLLIGLIETGLAFYDYMVLANANREGVRLGSRGRFEDTHIMSRIVTAGGMRELPDGSYEPNLRTGGSEGNLGIIITHIPIEADGSLGDITRVPSGTIVTFNGDDPVIQNITPNDTRLTGDDIARYHNEYAPRTVQINQYRHDQGYEPQRNEIVVVETFMMHPLLFNYPMLPFKDPLPFYYRSVMRVMRDASID